MSDVLYHPLETKLIEAVYKRKIDFSEIETILRQLLEQEIYITIRDKSGNVYDDVLLEEGLLWPGLKITKTREHNKKIDEIKHTRLAEIVAMIVKNAELNHIREYFSRNKLTKTP